MSETISYSEIPAGWAVPGSYGEVTTVPSGNDVTDMPLRLLVLGQKGSGTGTSLVRYQNISPSQAAALAGPASALAATVAAVVAAAPYVAVDMVMVDAPTGGTAGSATLTFDGPATANGTAAIEANGVRVPFVVTSGMAATDMAAAAAAAFTSDVSVQTGLNATADKGVLTLTSAENGVFVNDIDVRMSALTADLVPGMSVAVTAMTGGAGTVDLSAALALVSNVWFTDIVSCLNDAANLTALATEAERRYGAMIKRDAHVYYGYRGTYGQVLALAETLNSRFMTCIPAQNPRWAPWIVAGVAGAIAAQALNNDPSRQLHTLELTGLAGLAPDDADLFTDAMRNVLLQSGMSTFTVDQDGTVRIERMVTNNQKDATGDTEKAWRDIMVPKTVSRVRYEWNTYIDATYPRAKLADDTSSMVGIAAYVVTPKVLKGSWAAQSELYETVEGWLTDTDTLAQQAVFTIDPSDRNRCDAALPIRVMGSLIVVANSIQLQA